MTAGFRRAPSRGAPEQTRLPWWALALPALAFTVLFGLLVCGGGPAAAGDVSGPGSAGTRQSSGGPGAEPLEQLIAHLVGVLPG
ncbi:hypothetical protein [Streptomyces sp. HNM0574]|uniref:hypothetical protein n=1 Tax=Streptomyces sp. HNM0574 TaxID=2714954 RepID=UPI00146CC9CB|nr:hypothetical protein [Streptomyces sp. HNM0574]NLU67410.1 hypothetical protein [Streptomyces sp. HNM0574]